MKWTHSPWSAIVVCIVLLVVTTAGRAESPATQNTASQPLLPIDPNSHLGKNALLSLAKNRQSQHSPPPAPSQKASQPTSTIRGEEPCDEDDGPGDDGFDEGGDRRPPSAETHPKSEIEQLKQQVQDLKDVTRQLLSAAPAAAPRRSSSDDCDDDNDNDNDDQDAATQSSKGHSPKSSSAPPSPKPTPDPGIDKERLIKNHMPIPESLKKKEEEQKAAAARLMKKLHPNQPQAQPPQGHQPSQQTRSCGSPSPSPNPTPSQPKHREPRDGPGEGKKGCGVDEEDNPAYDVKDLDQSEEIDRFWGNPTDVSAPDADADISEDRIECHPRENGNSESRHWKAMQRDADESREAAEKEKFKRDSTKLDTDDDDSPCHSVKEEMKRQQRQQSSCNGGPQDRGGAGQPSPGEGFPLPPGQTTNRPTPSGQPLSHSQPLPTLSPQPVAPHARRESPGNGGALKTLPSASPSTSPGSGGTLTTSPRTSTPPPATQPPAGGHKPKCHKKNHAVVDPVEQDNAECEQLTDKIIQAIEGSNNSTASGDSSAESPKPPEKRDVKEVTKEVLDTDKDMLDKPSTELYNVVGEKSGVPIETREKKNEVDGAMMEWASTHGIVLLGKSSLATEADAQQRATISSTTKQLLDADKEMLDQPSTELYKQVSLKIGSLIETKDQKKMVDDAVMQWGREHGMIP